VLYAGRPDLMTRLITSRACGSRGMTLSFWKSPAAERLEHVVAPAALEVARALGEGGGVDQALVGQQLLERVQPALVLARRLALAFGVGDLGDQLSLELAPREGRFVAHRDGHAEDAALPRFVEDQLAVLSRQRCGAGHVGDLSARDWFHACLRVSGPPAA
jgi:hypothetical protein